MSWKKWTQSDDSFLRENYAKSKNDVLADQLNRSPAAVKDRAARLGVAARFTKKPWSKKDHLFLRDNINVMPSDAIAKTLGRSKSAVETRVYLFFRKSPCDLQYDDLNEAHFNPFLVGKTGGKASV
jgi:hypothetical protein